MSIKFKLTILTLVIIALITTGSYIVAIRSMDQALLDSLVKRGSSIALSASIPAGYSILTDDRLALDNLAAKIEASQEDIGYFAILDKNNHVLGHNKLATTGTLFQKAPGPPLLKGTGFTVHQIDRYGQASYEFRTPIQFGGSQVGDIIVGISTASLVRAKTTARQQILLVSLGVLAFGALCTFLLSRIITTPIERMKAGVSEITAGNYDIQVKTSSRDELGELTRSFNKMTRVIMSQKKHLQNYASNLEESYLSTVKILATALDARDNYTLGHSARVAKLSLLTGQLLGLTNADRKELEMACFLHDIGKIYTPDVIINKPGPLDQKESLIVKKHPEQGAEILRLSESLHKYIPVVLHHHEWYNGNGYPHGLKGEEIHIYAQIVAIADAYDAMTTSRPYRSGCTRDEATAEIINCRGSQFNPELTNTFLDALNNYEDDPSLFVAGETHDTHDFLSHHSSSVGGNIISLRDSIARTKGFS
jgi:putative nucleotidyltransferase with HDIG domain